jgi:hypothetical protein
MTIMSVIVTLQVINTSIDPADINPVSEDLSINDIESCVEFILEIVLKKSDAVSETDEQDESSSTPNSSVTLYVVENTFLLKDNSFQLISSHRFSGASLSFDSLTLPIIAPPPKS